MQISFLSSFYPYSSEITDGNNLLYRSLEKSVEIKAFNFSMLYPDLLFPGKEENMQVKPTEVIDIVENERILNTANPASYYFAASMINNINPDFFITRCWNSYLTTALGGVGKFIDKKKIKRFAIIDSLRSSEKMPLEEKSVKFFINNYDAFITFTQEAKNDILSVRPDAIITEHPLPFVVANESKIDKNIARRMLNISTNKRVLLFYGTIRQYKGIELIFQALSQLNDDYYLIIAGDSPSGYDYYKRKINDFNIAKKVHLIERNPNINEVPYIFTAADVLLLSYLENADKMPVNMAFSYELPVIASDIDNFREVIESKQFGIILEKNDAETLINAINRYYNENMASKFLNNLKALRYSHSWESLATMLFDLYDKLLSHEDLTIY